MTDDSLYQILAEMKSVGGGGASAYNVHQWADRLAVFQARQAERIAELEAALESWRQWEDWPNPPSYYMQRVAELEAEVSDLQAANAGLRQQLAIAKRGKVK